MAGYSGTPLVKKLGIKPGHRVAFIAAPRNYAATLGKLPPEVSVSRAPNGTLDFIQLFVRNRSELESEMPRAQRGWRKMECFGFPGPRNPRAFSLISTKMAFAISLSP